MRGLSERAPQFLRDHGEQGGSSPAEALVTSNSVASHPGPATSPAPGHCALSVREKKPVHGGVTLDRAGS